MDDMTLKYVLQISTSMAAPDSVPFNKQRMQRLRDVKPVWLPHNLVLALNCIELCSLGIQNRALHGPGLIYRVFQEMCTILFKNYRKGTSARCLRHPFTYNNN